MGRLLNILPLGRCVIRVCPSLNATWHALGVVTMTCRRECDTRPLGGSLPPPHDAHLQLVQLSLICFLLFKMSSAFVPLFITHASTDILYCDEKQVVHPELIVSIIVELGQTVHLHD